jgi:hypothetical protein
MENKPKGGRGLKAPYETITVRIPLPIKETVDKLSDDFRESQIVPLIHEINKIESSTISLEEAILKAQEILEDKKASKKVSFQRLLKAIYGQSINL